MSEKRLSDSLFVAVSVLSVLFILLTLGSGPNVTVANPERDARGELKVALVSSVSVPLNKRENLRHARTIVERAAMSGARLVVFPELSVTGYVPSKRLLSFSETVPGLSTARFAAMAKRYDVYISAGISERDSDSYYITQILVGPRGYIGKYRKHFPTAFERALGFSPGRVYRIWVLDGFSLSILISSDNVEKEAVEQLRKLDADIVLSPYAGFNPKLNADSWSKQKMRHNALRAARARAYLLLNNEAYNPKRPRRLLAGGALVISPLGRAIARTNSSTRGEAVIHATLKKSLLGSISRFESEDSSDSALRGK